MSGHAAGYRMNCESDIDATITEQTGNLLNRVLGLCDGHAIAWNQHDIPSTAQKLGCLGCTDGDCFPLRL